MTDAAIDLNALLSILGVYVPGLWPFCEEMPGSPEGVRMPTVTGLVRGVFSEKH